MGLVENGKSGHSKYVRMDSDFVEGENLQPGPAEKTNNKSTKKYVLACAMFASLNSVLLGYGLCLSPSVLLIYFNLICLIIWVFFFFFFPVS